MLPSFCEDLLSLNSLSLFSTEIWVITQSCPSKRMPSLRWRTCRSCEFDHGQLLLVCQCWCGTEHQVKLIMVCWESGQQTVLTSTLIPGPHFPLSPSTISSSKKLCKGIYFSCSNLMDVGQISHAVSSRSYSNIKMSYDTVMCIVLALLAYRFKHFSLTMQEQNQRKHLKWCYCNANFSGIFSPGRRLNTSSLLCDCQLKWLPVWVAEQTFLPCVNASCAHPQMLKGRSVFAVSQEEFVCGEWCIHSV